MPSLVVLSGQRSGATYPLTASTIAGRGPSCAIQILESTVSAVHAIFEQHGSWIVVRDLGSSNGVWLNGKRVRSAALRDGDRVHLGRVALQYRAADAWSVPEAASSSVLAGAFGRAPVSGEAATVCDMVSPFSREALGGNQRAYFPPGFVEPRSAG